MRGRVMSSSGGRNHVVMLEGTFTARSTGAGGARRTGGLDDVHSCF